MACKCKSVDVGVKLLYDDSIMPTKAHENDVGYDLCVHSVWVMIGDDLIKCEQCKYNNKMVWTPSHGHQYLIKAGFSMSLPVGYEAQIRPRSGLALKNKVSVSNSPGTIDPDYTQEVGVIIHIRHSGRILYLSKGDRIAQMVIKRVPQVNLIQVDGIDDTDRGEGFGSSGVQ